jgi:hypothetical protein
MLSPSTGVAARPSPRRERPLNRLRLTVFGLIAIAVGVPFAVCQTSVLTWHYDNARSSVNPSETLLTPANVNTSTFGKLFTQPVDGFVVGHPLYMPGLTIPGKGVHNVLFVATMHDSVYAFDADHASGANASPLWMTSLLNYSPPGATPAPISVVGCGGETAWTEVGVISTPVIDSQTDTLYALAETYENSKIVHRLHALDVNTGVEKMGGPITIAATFTKNGLTSTFVSSRQINRPGLLLANGHVYIGFGSNGCNNNNQGWILSYNAGTLQQEGVFDSEPGAFYASFWQKGAGLSADSLGNVYGETGEGQLTPGTTFPMSVVKLTQVGGSLSLTDWFTPYNWQYLDQNDLDLNDGVLILPDQPGSHPHELIGIGKEGTVYLLDRDNMGQLCASCTSGDTQIVQELPVQVGPETGTPVFWNNKVYFTAQHSPIQSYAMNNGMLVTPPVAQSVKMAGGGHAIITSSSGSNGVMWLINGGALWAMDPNTLKPLYTSSQAVNGRDTLPALAHFASPISADGKVFVGTRSSLVVYGLLPALIPTGGNNQTATVATTLALPIQVQARDPYSGATFPGVTVTFSDGGKGGTFASATAVTDATGTASTTYTLPTKAATYIITATAPQLGKGTFSETGTPGPATTLARVSGNLQTATVGTTLSQPLVAVAKDRFGNVVPGVLVTFGDKGAGGNFPSNPVTTNSKGRASALYVAPTKSGTVTITASAAGTPVLTFSETITAGPATSIVVASGNNQTAPPSTPLPQALVVKVTDQYGNPVPGASVLFDDGGRGGSFSVNPATTSTSGTASVNYTTPATTGVVQITATVSGVSTPAAFTVTVQ